MGEGLCGDSRLDCKQVNLVIYYKRILLVYMNPTTQRQTLTLCNKPGLRLRLDTRPTPLMVMEHVSDLLLSTITDVLHPSKRPWALPLHHAPVLAVQMVRILFVLLYLANGATVAVHT